ncbi:gag-pol polyprotein, putative [Wolbachia endosymbiont of Drosophila ananassae]|nr:gag-pol polyprotein, putative [Wolbachia endosymbiont of Drosophila ananassae]
MIQSVFGKMPFPNLQSITNIEMFFTKLESWFALQGLGARKEQEKFAAVIAYADPKYLEQVHDLVNNPPETAPYSTLKEAILSKFTDSEMVRLDRLATGIQLGDSRPSHLLCQLQQTKATCDESVVRRYWIKRLPPPVRAVIVGMIGSSPQTKLSQLAKAADAVMDSLNDDASDHVYAFSKSKQQQSHQEERVITLTKRLDDNDKALQQINNKLGQLLNHNQTRGRNNQRPQNYYRNNAPSNDRSSQQLCWYHNKYGRDAQRCSQPCSFTAFNEDDQKN